MGIIPKILSLKIDLPGVSLAISLHAPTQELRSEIVPAARGFPLSKLIAAVDAYLVGRCDFARYLLFILSYMHRFRHSKEFFFNIWLDVSSSEIIKTQAEFW